MAPKVDSAIIKALSLEPDSVKATSSGGSGFATTFKLSGTTNGETKTFFVKTNSGKSAEVMFRGEHASLNTTHDAVPNVCPKSYAYGKMSDSPDGYFLATDFLDLRSASASGTPGSGQSFASKLAKLHSTPAPVPEGHDEPMFGFPVTTCCGDSPQDNSWKASWADFYANNRLRGIMRVSTERQGEDGELTQMVERVADKVVPKLLGEQTLGQVVPVVVHGDLWSGNHSRGRIGGQGGVEEVVYDPSAVYGHSEYELGVMKMFGGGGSAFWKEYLNLVPKAEPKEEWEDRVKLYELYHHLNHNAMFGGGYRSGAMSIMKQLVSKYEK